MAKHYMQRIFDRYGKLMSLPSDDIFDTGGKLLVSEYIARLELDFEQIRKQIDELTRVRIVDDIWERNNLQSVKSGTPCFVWDATGDDSVGVGSALYVARVYSDKVIWDKVFELESLDLKLTWENVTGKPNSRVEDIDKAVSVRHSHANKESLAGISENEDGRLAYNGKELNGMTAVSFMEKGVKVSDGLLIVSEIVEISENGNIPETL